MNSLKRELVIDKDEGNLKKQHVDEQCIKTESNQELKEAAPVEYNANDVVFFHEVSVTKGDNGENHLLQICPTFKPGMSHQVFEDEKIVGIKDPQIDIYFNPSTCDMCVITKCDGNPEDKKKLSKKVRKWTTEGTNINRSIYLDRILPFETDFKPLGIPLHHYSVNDQSFTIYLNTLTSEASILLFKNIQSLGYWFIDGASEIVVVPDSPHRWLMLTVYTPVENKPVLVGYCLLYIFTNPFHTPSYSLRLCQILILPPYQKQGHSFRVFDVIYQQLLHISPSHLIPASYHDMPCVKGENCEDLPCVKGENCEDLPCVKGDSHCEDLPCVKGDNCEDSPCVKGENCEDLPCVKGENYEDMPCMKGDNCEDMPCVKGENCEDLPCMKGDNCEDLPCVKGENCEDMPCMKGENCEDLPCMKGENCQNDMPCVKATPCSSPECCYYMYTIEDPCEEFVFVRDVYDCKLLLKHKYLDEYLQGDIRELTNETKEMIRRCTGIIPEQTQKCYNILLHHYFSNQNSKQYRLFIKHQITKKYRNELELIREKDVFKATVGIYFDSTESYYESVCKVVFK